MKMMCEASVVGSFGTGTSERIRLSMTTLSQVGHCALTDVRNDVAARLTGTHRDAIAEVVRRLHCRLVLTLTLTLLV